MKFSTNHQGLLAEKFFVEEITLIHESYTAMMKIKRWKFILQIPGIGSKIIDEAENSIHDSFFAFVTNLAVIRSADSLHPSSIN